jgi:hypothetical protein
MRVLKDTSKTRSESATSLILSQIKNAYRTVVRTSCDQFSNFMMPLHAAQRRGRFKCDFRSVRIV